MAHALSTRALSLAQTLVQMNTVSDRSNLELIDFVRDLLAGLGIRSRLTFNDDRSKANLFATLGAGKPAGVILSGHTDTVPWEGQDWSVDPLSGTVQDWPSDGEDSDAVRTEPRLYGRGAADMKGFIAMVLANAERFLHSESPFAVHLALSYDEELGCLGVRSLIADMKEAGIAPVACIVGEPTHMVPAIAHKGVYRYCCRVRGKAAHSSLTNESVNAIEMAAMLVDRLRGMAQGFERDGPFYRGFDVPFSTASVGQFHGGIADNVVPASAWFRYEFRNLPGVDAATMQKALQTQARMAEEAMKRVAPDAGFDFEPLCEVPSFQGQASDAITRLAQQLSQQSRTTLVAFGTEAGLFKNAGIPSVVCGPGSILQAHQADEYVTLEQLARCDLFLKGLAAAKRIG